MKNDSASIEKRDFIPRNLSSFADSNNTLNPLKLLTKHMIIDLPFCDSEESSSKASEELNSSNTIHFPEGEGIDYIKVEVEKSTLLN